MQKKTFSLTLNQLNPKFIIKDKGGIKLIKIIKIRTEQQYDSAFWANLHLRVIDQKELSLFDHAFSDYIPSGTPVQEVWLEKQFVVIDHLTIELYAESGNEFSVEVDYELGYD